MLIQVRNACDDFKSYRAARVKSLFNAESGANFNLDAEVPGDDEKWQIGVIAGPSGTGKTSIGRQLLGGRAMYAPEWPANTPIVEAIAPDGDFDAVTAALSTVGLGTVPAWLRPYHALSNGEQFRANMARLIAEAPAAAVLDEFTSVVDRQIAKIGALAFAKAWRRTAGRVVLLTCHYDILDWVQPDWVLDTATGKLTRGWLRPRPTFSLELWQTDWSMWPLFEPHHYLKLAPMPAARCYVGTVDGQPVCHIGVGCKNVGKHGVEARACRLVVMPEWQGAGVGLRFLNQICQWQLEGHEHARLPGRRLTTIFHTSHPGLCAALRRNPAWRQVSANLYGGNKAKSAASIARANRTRPQGGMAIGYGGHFRAVQGFRYVGAQPQASKP